MYEFAVNLVNHTVSRIELKIDETSHSTLYDTEYNCNHYDYRALSEQTAKKVEIGTSS